MAQLNINITEQFKKDLAQYMKKKNLARKSDALREALHEAVLRLKNQEKKTDFSKWLGLALKAPQNPHPRFKSDAELWEK